jgi:hypothetical protein
LDKERKIDFAKRKKKQSVKTTERILLVLSFQQTFFTPSHFSSVPPTRKNPEIVKVEAGFM